MNGLFLHQQRLLRLHQQCLLRLHQQRLLRLLDCFVDMKSMIQAVHSMMKAVRRFNLVAADLQQL